MAEPSNIRINPFTGTGGATNYVELTEKHIIPANSPYVIRLNEVPEKQDPSNIKMVYVDSATGAATSTTLTEVAATPGQGEFRMDYTTNAMEDKTWNTGLVEFSAADAGKIIQITYTGTGTLAAVNSNHWPSWYTDRGDGSDGDFVPTEDITISGVKNYKSVIIKEGITVKTNGEVVVKVEGLIKISGTLDASGTNGGDAGEGGIGKGGTGGGTGGAGGSVNSDGKPGEPGTGGGAGGAGQPKRDGNAGNGGAGGSSGGSINVLYGGSGAGGGGGGGGYKGAWHGAGGGGGGKVLAIIANDILITSTGKITTKGGQGGNASFQFSGSGGGGGGGDLILIAQNIINNGTLDSSGGEGGPGAAKGEDGTKFIKQLGAL